MNTHLPAAARAGRPHLGGSLGELGHTPGRRPIRPHPLVCELALRPNGRAECGVQQREHPAREQVSSGRIQARHGSGAAGGRAPRCSGGGTGPRGSPARLAQYSVCPGPDDALTAHGVRVCVGCVPRACARMSTRTVSCALHGNSVHTKALSPTFFTPFSPLPLPSLIVQRRSELDRAIKSAAWNTHRCDLLEIDPHQNPKLTDYVQRFQEDLLRKRLDRCAPYLEQGLSPAQQACLLLFRTGGSLIALHSPDITAQGEDDRCEGCRKHNPASIDVCEDIPHALFRCVKGPPALERHTFMQAMEDVCASFSIRDEKGAPVHWSQLDDDTQSCLALGGLPPPGWQLASYPSPRDRRGREIFRAELTEVAAPFLQAIARGLRGFRVAIIRDLAAGDGETWPRVRQLWNLGPLHEEMSESDSLGDDEMELEED